MKRLLAIVNITSLHHKHMKAKESEIGEKIKDLATASCQEALDAEQKAVKERLSLGDDEAVPLSVSYDAGWSTRGSGRSYN